MCWFVKHCFEVRPSDPSPLPRPGDVLIARDGLVQFECSFGRMSLQLVDESELVTPPRAVEERDPDGGLTPEQVVEHRTERRDSCAPRYQQHACVVFKGWQGKRAKRPFDIEEHSGNSRAKMSAQSAVALDRNEQLDPSRVRRLFRRAGD